MSSSASEIDADLVPAPPSLSDVSITEHLDAIAPRHRGRVVSCFGERWAMNHLEPFAFRIDPGLGFEVTVVVHFSSHCFTRSLKWDGRPIARIPAGELFNDGQEIRVLCEFRHSLSIEYLPRLIRELPRRAIRFARDLSQNFITVELIEGKDQAPAQHYVVFFEVSRDPKRRRRLLLKVQSAYVKEPFEPRLTNGRRVSFSTLLKATFMRRALKS